LILDFFTDPILRPSTLGSMLMCFASALVGVVVFLRKRSLIGETLSHASFPGVVTGVAIASFFLPFQDEVVAIAILCGASLFALLGLKILDVLETRLHVKTDSALCFVLASFFGLGILIASSLQQTHPLWYKQALIFLYGQAATMTNVHVVIYGCFGVVIAGFILYFYRYLETVNFDPAFAETLGIRSKQLDRMMFFFIVLAIVVGIRSVGVVLMSGMLIGPAIAARPLTKQLSHHFALAGFFGICSGFLGNYLSVIMSNDSYSLPTGPMILLVSSTFCFLSLLLAPRSGLIIRHLRMRHFKFQCAVENALKALWKDEKTTFSPFIRRQLRSKGWVDAHGLTLSGKQAAEKIIRLHRLWEVYLVDYLGQKVEKVHQTAEELEHLMSPDLERELTELLQNPRHDPHHQPIPPRQPT
jgi:manganese/zinc/iron transport system permease protein